MKDPGRGETRAIARALPSFARRVEGGVEIALKVVPGASRSEIVGALGSRLKLRVAAPPERGKANDAVVRLLREWLGTPGVEIVAGYGSPEKTARISSGFPEDRERAGASASRQTDRSRWLDRLLDFEKRNRSR